jgi:hypothetical protein
VGLQVVKETPSKEEEEEEPYPSKVDLGSDLSKLHAPSGTQSHKSDLTIDLSPSLSLSLYIYR